MSATKPLTNGDENKERGNWSNKMDFLLSCLGYAVGLGNVWRFPYLCYKNGGGAFLIPYVIMLAFAGLPLFFLEVSFGQYCSQGPITAWRACPAFRGVGYGMLIVSGYVAIYYNVIIMYAIYYLFSSFTSTLPWIGCHKSWNTPMCSELYSDCIAGEGIIALNSSCLQLDNMTAPELAFYNITPTFETYDLSLYKDPFEGMRKRPSEEFWKENVLHEADSMNEPGGVVWQLALCLLLAWIIVFLCLFKGIKSSGKVVYFTATFPYLVLFILLIRGVTLPGHLEGIKFFIVPKFDRLSDPQVWLDAAVQIFYSLSAAWGGLLTLASYNKFHNNCFFDSMFVAIANCCTSVFAGFVIFSIIGYMAHELGKPVDEVVDQGFGLAFIAYPEAVASLPGAPFWAILFFFMLLTLGLDSQFAIMETIVTAICDEFPHLHRKKTYVLGTACLVGYFLGFSCLTEAGPYWVSMMDSYGASFALLIFATCETIAISWLYGLKRFINDIRSMVGDRIVDHPAFLWWVINWCTITPALLVFIILFNWMNWNEPTYNGDYPGWARGIGWCMILSSILWIPIIFVYEFFRGTGGSARERWEQMTSPRANWGPALQQHRDEAWSVHKKHGSTMGGLLNLDGLPSEYEEQPAPVVRYYKGSDSGVQPGNGGIETIKFGDDNPVYEQELSSQDVLNLVYAPKSLRSQSSERPHHHTTSQDLYDPPSRTGSQDVLNLAYAPKRLHPQHPPRHASQDLHTGSEDELDLNLARPHPAPRSSAPSSKVEDNLGYVTGYPDNYSTGPHGSEEEYPSVYPVPRGFGPLSNNGSQDVLNQYHPAYTAPHGSGPPSRHGSQDLLNQGSSAYTAPRVSGPPSRHDSQDLLNQASSAYRATAPRGSGPPSRHGSQDLLNQGSSAYRDPRGSGPPSRHGSQDLLNQGSSAYRDPRGSGPPSRHGSQDLLNQGSSAYTAPRGSGPPSLHGSQDLLNQGSSAYRAPPGSGLPSRHGSQDAVNLDYIPQRSPPSHSSQEGINPSFQPLRQGTRPQANAAAENRIMSLKKDKKERWRGKKKSTPKTPKTVFDSPMELDFESDC